MDGSGRYEPATGAGDPPGAGSAHPRGRAVPAQRRAGEPAMAGPETPAGGPDAAGPGIDGPGTSDAGAASGMPGGPPAGGGGLPGADDLPGTVAALTGDDLDQSERRRLLRRLAGQLRRRGVADLLRPRAALRWVADAVSDVAPRLPIRDAETLRRHHPGLSTQELAERLIRNAARTTAAIGAASGGVAAIEWAAPPTLLSAPVLLAAETVAVVAIEIKMIGELHEVYGQPVAGNRADSGRSEAPGPAVRSVALVQAWARRRGVNPIMPGMGVAAVLGTAARRELRDRLLRRFGRNLTTYGPLLTGAAVASYLNRRATITLGQQIQADLARRGGPGQVPSARPR